MVHQAVGMVEVYGLVAAFAACDAGCKAGNVTVEKFDKNKPANADSLPVPLLVCVKFRGGVSDVRAAVDAKRSAVGNNLRVVKAQTDNAYLRRYGLFFKFVVYFRLVENGHYKTTLGLIRGAFFLGRVDGLKNRVVNPLVDIDGLPCHFTTIIDIAV